VFPIGPHTRCSFPQSLRINLGHPSYLFESVSQPVSRWYCGFHLDIRTPPPLVTSPPPRRRRPRWSPASQWAKRACRRDVSIRMVSLLFGTQVIRLYFNSTKYFPFDVISFFEVYAYLACSFVRPWVYFNYIYSEHPPQIKEVGRFYHTRDQLTRLPPPHTHLSP